MSIHPHSQKANSVPKNTIFRTQLPISPIKMQDYYQTDQTPSPKNIHKQKQKLVQSLQSQTVIRNFSTEPEYKQLKLQSPIKTTLNTLPSRNFPSPLRETTEPNIGKNMKTELTSRVNTQYSNAEHLKTDLISITSQGTQFNKSGEEHAMLQTCDKENQIRFKEIKFNRKNSGVRDSCTKYENKKKSKSFAQIQQLNEELSQEISSLTNVENANIDQFEDLFQENQKELLNQIQQRDQHIEQILQQFQQLQQENDQLRQQYKQPINPIKYQTPNNEQSETIKILRNQIVDQEQNYQEQQLQVLKLLSYKNQIQEFEQKLKKVTQENEQYKSEIQKYQQQQQNYRGQFNQIKELEYLVEVCQSEQDGFIKSLESKESEIQYLKGRLAIQQEQLLKQKQESIKLCYENQNLIQDKLVFEQQLNSLKIAQQQLQEQKNEIEQLQVQNKQLIEDQQEFLENSKRINSMNETFKIQYHQIQNENQQLVEQKDELIELQNELEEQISQMRVENEELHKNMDQITQNYQNQFIELQKQLDEWFKTQIEMEIQKVLEPIQTEKDYYVLQFEEQALKNENLQQINSNLKKENDNLNKQHKQLLDQIQDCETQCLQMATQRKNIKIQEINELTEELMLQNEENDKNQKSIKQLIKRNHQLENQVQKSNAELMTLNAEKIAFETHILQLKDKLTQNDMEFEYQIQQNQSLIDNKIQQLNQLGEQLKQAQQKIQQVDEINRNQQNQIQNDINDQADLQQQIISQTSIIKNLKKQIDNHIILQQNLQIEQDQLQERYTGKIKELNQQRIEISKLMERNQELQNLIEEQQKQKQNDDLKTQEMTEQLRILKENKDRIIKQNEDNQLEIALKNKELVNAIEAISQLKQKYEEELEQYEINQSDE